MTISNFIQCLSILSHKFESSGKPIIAFECSDLANKMLDEECLKDKEGLKDVDIDVELINHPLDSDPYYRNSGFVVYQIPESEYEVRKFQIYILHETADTMAKYQFNI